MTSEGTERPDERIRRLEESLSNLARNFDLIARSPSLTPSPEPEPPQPGGGGTPPGPTPVGPGPRPDPAAIRGIRNPLERPSDFKRALTRLATDVEYRKSAMQSPEIILQDYRLTVRELESLKDVAKLSGADITAVNRLRASEITRGIGTAADVDVSCCSCCCCCCGETSVVTARGVVTAG